MGEVLQDFSHSLILTPDILMEPHPQVDYRVVSSFCSDLGQTITMETV
jgi:hypothetical protein